MLIQIAWRNVWRNKTRSLVIIIAVALGLWGGIFSDAFMQGMAEQQIYSVIHTETGHIQLNQPGFLLNHDMQMQIKNADSIVAAIKTKPGVEGVAAIIQLPAMASTASGSSGIMVNGIQPPDQEKVSDLSKLLIQGDYFKSDRANQVVIGQQLADKLKVKLHSRIVLTLQTSAGDIIYGAFKVSGIFRTHDSEFDKQMIFVRNKDIQQLVGFPAGAASIITVLLQNNDDTKKMATTFQQQYSGMQVQSWIQLSPMLQILSGTMIQFTLIFVGIILIALAFGIINTMLMAVMDRTREIGMLLSIGMKPSKVFGMIMLETIFLSLTGAIIGVVISITTISFFGHHGINLSMIAEGFNAFGYSSIVYPTLGVNFYIMLAIMVIMIAIIAGLFPARRAVRLRPAEAVRGD
ncbi:MAG TPA: FtsX-like permease family protein [Hanamia sp.]|nr:FtsX-like permease family protein [Hanamia sp.]